MRLTKSSKERSLATVRGQSLCLKLSGINLCKLRNNRIRLNFNFQNLVTMIQLLIDLLRSNALSSILGTGRHSG
jgi:hypothetical protein